jgi:hypothetical protein
MNRNFGDFSDFSNVKNSIGESIGLTEKKTDWVKIALIVGVLALLGLNIFTYLSQITDWFANTFGPLFRGTVGTAANVIGDTASQTIQTAATGSTAAIQGVAQGTTTGIGELQQAISGQMMRNNIDNKNIYSTTQENGQNNRNIPPFVMEQDDDDIDETIISKKN